MGESIIVALITGVLSLAGIVVTTTATRRKISADFQRNAELADSRLESKIAVIDTRLDALTEEVRKHNNFAARLPVLEEKIANLEGRVSKLETK